MGFTDAVRSCLVRYAELTGRARRSECWWFLLATTAGYVAVAVVGAFLAGALGASNSIVGGVVVSVLSVVYALVGLALVLPTVAVAVRRLHDTDRSGAWALLGVVPLVGTFLLAVLLYPVGTAGPNRFGPAPGTPDPQGPPPVREAGSRR